MKVALVHDWLTGMRGGEYVLDAIAELFPKAELFTLIHQPGSVSPHITALSRHTSFLQKIPYATKKYRHFLPLMPKAIEKFDLSGFDLIISSSHCVAKGVQKPEGAVHVSYVHAPMRYVWDRYDDYFGPGRASLAVRFAAKSVRSYLQSWDQRVSTPDRIDGFIANSHYIASLIEKFYTRKAKVVHPFVDLERFNRPRRAGRNYVIVGAFAPYKRIDLAIDAFNELELPLLIVGSGQDEHRLKRIAGRTIDFLGPLSNGAIEDLLSKARALIYPGKEDFGITPLESLASGAPVIAYGSGGALETVTDETGIFFRAQEVESLMGAVHEMEKNPARFTEKACRERAREFSKTRFQKEFLEALRDAWLERGKPREDLGVALETSWVPESREWVGV